MNEQPNPYANLDMESSTFRAYQPRPQDLGVVKQVKIVSILQIVSSLLEMCMGAGLIGVGFMLGYSMSLQDEFDAAQQDMMVWVQGFYSAFGGIVILLGLGRLAAGITGFWYRGYWFTVASLFAGLISTFTCYCGPTSIGLCIYGLIIYFNPAVVHVYKLMREGMSLDEILAQFEPPSRQNYS